MGSGSHTAAARSHTGSSTRRRPAPIARFGDVCFADNDDDTWRKRGGPTKSRKLESSQIETISPRIRGLFSEQGNLHILFFFLFFFIALFSLMYVSVDGCAECLQLTSVDATSPLSLEREEGMGRLGARAQPRRCSALFRGRTGFRPHSTP